MRLFILISFWCYVLSIVGGMGLLASAQYPRKREARTMGVEVFHILLAAGLAVWCAWMLWL